MNSPFFGLLYFSILMNSIMLGAIYGALIDEGWVTPNISTFFVIVMSLNILCSLWFIYKKDYIGLFIYGAIIIIFGLAISYHEYFMIMKRGVGIYGNITPFLFILSGAITTSVALYFWYRVSRLK